MEAGGHWKAGTGGFAWCSLEKKEEQRNGRLALVASPNLSKFFASFQPRTSLFTKTTTKTSICLTPGTSDFANLGAFKVKLVFAEPLVLLFGKQKITLSKKQQRAAYT